MREPSGLPQPCGIMGAACCHVMKVRVHKTLGRAVLMCADGVTQSLCAPTFGEAQAAADVMNAVDGRFTETRTRGWYIDLARA